MAANLGYTLPILRRPCLPDHPALWAGLGRKGE